MKEEFDKQTKQINAHTSTQADRIIKETTSRVAETIGQHTQPLPEQIGMAARLASTATAVGVLNIILVEKELTCKGTKAEKAALLARDVPVHELLDLLAKHGGTKAKGKAKARAKAKPTPAPESSNDSSDEASSNCSSDEARLQREPKEVVTMTPLQNTGSDASTAAPSKTNQSESCEEGDTLPEASKAAAKQTKNDNSDEDEFRSQEPKRRCVRPEAAQQEQKMIVTTLATSNPKTKVEWCDAYDGEHEEDLSKAIDDVAQILQDSRLKDELKLKLDREEQRREWGKYYETDRVDNEWAVYIHQTSNVMYTLGERVCKVSLRD